MVGGSKKEVYKVADMMGYMTVLQGRDAPERLLCFMPSPNYLAKDSGGIGNVQVAPVAQYPTQLADIIQATKDRINSLSNEQVKAMQELDEVRAEIMECESVEQLNDILIKLDPSHILFKEMQKSIWNFAKSKGYTYNKDTGRLEDKAVENA